MKSVLVLALLLTLSKAECGDGSSSNSDEAPTTTSPGYSCPEVYEPVCSTDGVTYGNSCYLSLANKELAYKGECGSPIEEES